MIAISMSWCPYLSVNDRYTRGTRPRMRPEVAAWQEELAWEIKSSITALDIDLGKKQVVVDVEMYFPRDGPERDPDDYIKTICDAVQMGTGMDDSNFIPYIRLVVRDCSEAAGFLIRLYPAAFTGHGLTGTISHQNGPDGDTIIILDEDLPADWRGTKVQINLGVIRE